MAALAAERAVLAPSRRLLVEIFAPSITDPEAFIAGRVSLGFVASACLHWLSSSVGSVMSLFAISADPLRVGPSSGRSWRPSL